MGFNMSRDRINQALIQTRGNLDNAIVLLLDWQAQGDMGIADIIGQPNRLGDDILSDESDENEDIMMAIALSEGSQ